MNKLPDNVVRIDIVKIERNISKLCQCSKPKYTIDDVNKFVYCDICGAIVDPYEALLKIGRKCDSLNTQVENLLEQAREIQEYKPHLKIFKEMEKNYKNNQSLLPCCPNCHEIFDFKDIKTWSSKEYAQFIRKNNQEK